MADRDAVVGDAALFEFDHVFVPGLHADHPWRLQDVVGAIAPAGVTALVGPSGSGKSTLLRLCNRLEVPSAGRVLYNGDDIARLDPIALRRRVGMVFQRPTPFAGTALDNLRVADPGIDHASAVTLLERVRLDAGFLDRDASELSGGEQQRLCLARSLAPRPHVLLMDEVTSSVDPSTKVALERLARDCAEAGTPVVWVTHDISQAQRIADEMLVVADGRIADDAAARAFVEEARYAE